MFPPLLCSLSLLNSIIPSFHISKFIIPSLPTQLPLFVYSACDMSLRSISFSLFPLSWERSPSALTSTRRVACQLCPCFQVVTWLPSCPSTHAFLHLVLLLTFSAAHNHFPCALTILPPFLPRRSCPSSTRLDEFPPHFHVLHALVPWLTPGPGISFLSIFAW